MKLLVLWALCCAGVLAANVDFIGPATYVVDSYGTMKPTKGEMDGGTNLNLTKKKTSDIIIYPTPRGE